MYRVQNHNCKTCEGQVESGKYCPDCGLHNIGKQTTLWSFIREGFEQVVSLENGFFVGIKNSILHPKSIVIDYYNGYRNHSPTPGKMVLYTLLVLGLTFLVFGNLGFLDISVSGQENDEFNGVKIFMIILIPFIILSSKILFWNRHKGLVVHMVSTAFLFLTRFMVLVLISFIFGHLFEDPSMLLFIGLLFTLFWFFYSNSAVFGVDSILLRMVYALIQLIILLALMTLVISMLFIFAYAKIIVN